MKSVMISIQPQWVEKILNGVKTVEIRKSVPKLKPPFKCYIYCTKAKVGKSHQYDAFGVNGKPVECGGTVVAEFACDEIKYHGMEDLIVKEDAERALAGSCLTRKQVIDYLGGKNTDYDYDPHRFDFYGWHISDLKVYEKPKELNEFYKCGALSPEELDEKLCDYCSSTDYGRYKCSSSPNGAIFCEGRWCDSAYEEYLEDEFTLTRPPQSWCYVEERMMNNDNI